MKMTRIWKVTVTYRNKEEKARALEHFKLIESTEDFEFEDVTDICYISEIQSAQRKSSKKPRSSLSELPRSISVTYKLNNHHSYSGRNR